MHKLQNGSQVTGRPVRKPRVGTRGYFSESNDQGAPSHPGQDWFNDCIDEFTNALEQADIPYDPQRLDHLARAIAEAKANWGADVVSQAEAQAGEAPTARKWTAQRVRQAIVAWWDSIPKGTAFNKNFGSTVGTVCPGNDSRLSDAREWLANTVSQAEAEAGESATPRKWTAHRVHQAFKRYGLGVGATIEYADAHSVAPVTHFIRFNNNTLNTPLPNSFWQGYTTAGDGFQLITVDLISSNAVQNPRTFKKANRSGVWTDWVEVSTSVNTIAIDQAWVNVTSSRTAGITYTNNTLKPIQLFITAALGANTAGSIVLEINNQIVANESASSHSFTHIYNPIIMPQQTYRLSLTGNASIRNWWELR